MKCFYMYISNNIYKVVDAKKRTNQVSSFIENLNDANGCYVKFTEIKRVTNWDFLINGKKS